MTEKKSLTSNPKADVLKMRWFITLFGLIKQEESNGRSLSKARSGPGARKGLKKIHILSASEDFIIQVYM